MSSICFDCKNATPLLCAWIDSGDRAGLVFKTQERGGEYVCACDRYKKGRLPAAKLDTGQALHLAAVIVAQAGKDLGAIHKETQRIRWECGKGKLAEYVERKTRKKGGRLPFVDDNDFTALSFFTGRDRFANELLDFCELHSLPDKIINMAEDVESYKRHCLSCVLAATRKAGR